MASGTGLFPDGFFAQNFWATGYWYTVSSVFVIGPWLGFNPKWEVPERYEPLPQDVVSRHAVGFLVNESKLTEAFAVVEMNP